jgi:hypothetical protein
MQQPLQSINEAAAATEYEMDIYKIIRSSVQ